MPIGMTIVQTLVDALLVVVVLVASVLPAICMALLQVKIASDPAILRHLGIVVKDTGALESAGPIVGSYREAPIYEEVVFKGLKFRYERVVPPEYPRSIRANELFLAPGVLYRAVD